MPSPAVSVAISLYNKEAHIGAALRSVLAQSFQDFEVVVVDDGSTDGGPAIVQGFDDPRVKLHRQSNGGVSAARNAGLQLARRDIVAFLDADDLWRPRHLEHLIKLRQRWPDAVLYGNGFIATDNAANAVTDNIQSYERLDDYFARWVTGPAPFHTSSSMATRATALQIGGFPVGFSRGEDLAFFVRMALAGAVAVSSYVGCLYVRRPSGLTSRPLLQPDICMTTILDLLREPARLDEPKRASLREFLSKVAIANALDCMKSGYRAEALRFLEIASGTRLQRWRWWQARLLAGSPQPLRTLAFSMRDLAR
jgi:Glycosyl transferase family 2